MFKKTKILPKFNNTLIFKCRIWLDHFIDFLSFTKKFNILKNILVLIISLVVLPLIMYLFNKYVVFFIGDIFDVNVIYSNFYNIFNKTINFELIIKIPFTLLTDSAFVSVIISMPSLSISKRCILRRCQNSICFCHSSTCSFLISCNSSRYVST